MIQLALGAGPQELANMKLGDVNKIKLWIVVMVMVLVIMVVI